MSTLSRVRLENLAAEYMEREFDRVPRMRELHEGTWIERDYYVRHIVETVLRIRLNNEVDTYALFRVGSKDDSLAANLAKYLAEEFGHEHMFTRDLVRFGFPVEQLDRTPVFPSTNKLMGFLRLAADKEGPAPTTVWDWFVEWYSDCYNQIITTRAAEEFGADLVRGSQTHIEFDTTHDHDDLMFRVVSRAVETWSTAATAESYLDTFVSLIGDYFGELHAATARDRGQDQDRDRSSAQLVSS
ncbi:hypothetical protein AB1484_17125 [Parafrankia sp. FMc6]|uniref:hypothetical protein n=1 Tax=Parafrankia soli TaxID=2599596 RepID=UPI0034D5153D